MPKIIIPELQNCDLTGGWHIRILRLEFRQMLQWKSLA